MIVFAYIYIYIYIYIYKSNYGIRLSFYANFSRDTFVLEYFLT